MMMKTIDQLHLRVCDRGLFLPVAQRLGRECRLVSYWTPRGSPFPSVTNNIGDGFPGVKWVECCYQDIEDVDAFVFPDIGLGGLQEHLREMGYPVWGAGRAELLEINRGQFLTALKEVGLLVAPHERIKGAVALQGYLRKNEDRYIKISRYRGDWETMHWRSWKEDEDELLYRLGRLGPFRETITFYVFEPIDTQIEDGADAYCVGGKFPELVIHGMEAKDKAYIGTVAPLDALPVPVLDVCAQFGPLLGRYDYRSFFSCEVRVTKEGEGYFIDPTCRCGSPPSQVQAEIIGNYAEVIWEGANGNLVEMQPAAKFGVQALCNFKRDPDSWSYVKLKGDLDRWLKSASCLAHEGMLAIPPSPHHTQCEDWLVGIGDTMGEAIRHLQHNIKDLPDGVSCDASSLAEVLREIDEAEKQGMEFTDQRVPPPKIVLDTES